MAAATTPEPGPAAIVSGGGAIDAVDAGASEEDARLVRHVRRRLLLFSGGSTLLVLLVLGVALYAATANTLASASVSQLSARVDPVASALQGTATDHQQPPGFGFQLGAGNTFLFAFDSQGQAVQLGRDPYALIQGLPQQASLAAARTAPDGRDTWTGELSIGPVRILTQRVTYQADGQTYFLQALQDRSTEVDTLDMLLVVLILGGLVVVLVAAGFGWVYAQRALVPIRDSLAAQRAALGRQREFAADASHELRTPLTVIRSSVEHLRRHADEPVAKVGDALEDIDAEVSHLTTMVDDLLLLARSDSGAITLERVPLHLDDVAAEAAAALTGPAAGRNVRVVVDPEPVQLTGDPARLRQLTTILIDNAIRHSPAGGEVRVTVRSFEDEAQLSVADQGPGIRPDDLPHVFDRFWRAAGAPAGGTGLGLAIAKWIAERHAGSITASNGANGGALFVVRLPIEPTPD
jgi:signal transduction histidine kinase